MFAQATVNLLGSSEAQGKVDVQNGNVFLGDSAKAMDIQVATKGKLTVKENWAGSAVVNFAAALEENLVPAANGAAEGNFTGSLTTPAGGKITNSEGRLAVEGATQQDPDQLVLDGDNKGYCQACGTDVVWTGLTKAMGDKSDGAVYHFYLTKDISVGQWSFGSATKGTKICLHLNGFKITGGRRISVGGEGSVLSILGKGVITCDGTSENQTYVTGTVTALSGTLNLLGGEYISTAANGTPAVQLTGGVCNLGGKATAGSIKVEKAAKLNVKADFAGMAAVNFAAALEENLVPAANGAAEGDFTGKLVTQSGEKISHKEGKLLVEAGKLALDANNMGYCQHCKAMVEWKAAGVTGLSTKNDGQHHHLYMTANFDQTWGYLTLTTNTKLCLHLNGFNIQQKGRIFVSGAELNLMGKGTVASTVAHTNATYNTGAITVNNATVNIYGGTYESPLADIPAIRTQNAASRVNLLGGKVTGSAVIGKGILTLGGKAIAEDLQVEAEGILNVRADWAGTAKATFAVALAEGKVPAANGASEGVFSGTLTIGTTKLIGKDGLLEEETAQ